MYGNHSERLGTRLLDFYYVREPLRAFGYPVAGFYCVREPLRAFDYPVAGFLLCTGTFGNVWLPGRWISTMFGNLWERLVTRLLDFYSAREPLGVFGYTVAGNFLCSGTFGNDWLPGCWISTVFGNH